MHEHLGASLAAVSEPVFGKVRHLLLFIYAMGPICDKDDVPSFWYPTPDSLHTLGATVPLLYRVRNLSAHGQKVPDSHFGTIAHPFGGTVEINVLAEAATFIIRKTIGGILQRGFRENFKSREAREEFWLYNFGLDKQQSKKRLRAMDQELSEVAHE